MLNQRYSYDSQKRIQPYWSENVMYNESLAMVQDGEDICAYTLFVPKRIISVMDNTLTHTYKEGVDYKWVEGTNCIKLPEGSSIPYFFQGALDGLESPGSSAYVKDWDGSFDDSGRCRLGGVLYCTGKFLYEKHVAITYEYDINDAAGVTHAVYQGDKLPRLIQKIKRGQEITVLFCGASNFEGCDASGLYNRAPYCPTMSNLVSDYLNAGGIKARVINQGVGGWNIKQALASVRGEQTYDLRGTMVPLVDAKGKPIGNRFKNQIKDGSVDLLLLGYMGGTNTRYAGFSPQEHKQYIKEVIAEFRKYNPECEVVIMDGTVMNPDSIDYTMDFILGNREVYSETDGCGIIYLYQMYRDILARKRIFVSISGNNVNHPNDWLERVIAQNILACFVPGYADKK